MDKLKVDRLQPAGANMIVEEYRDVAEGIVTPDGVKGQLFTVIEVGDGYITDSGKKIGLEAQPGDIVAIAGKVLNLPFKGDRYLVARADDVIAFNRKEKLDIPDSI